MKPQKAHIQPVIFSASNRRRKPRNPDIIAVIAAAVAASSITYLLCNLP